MFRVYDHALRRWCSFANDKEKMVWKDEQRVRPILTLHDALHGNQFIARFVLDQRQLDLVAAVRRGLPRLKAEKASFGGIKLKDLP